MISRNSIKGRSNPSKESNHKQWAASRNNLHTDPSSELSSYQISYVYLSVCPESSENKDPVLQSSEILRCLPAFSTLTGKTVSEMNSTHSLESVCASVFTITALHRYRLGSFFLPSQLRHIIFETLLCVRTSACPTGLNIISAPEGHQLLQACLLCQLFLEWWLP